MLVHRTTRSATPGADVGRSGDRIEAEHRLKSVAGDDSRTCARDVIRAVILTAEEERELGWLVAHEGCQMSRERLIRGHLRLAAGIAENYLNRGLSLEELIEAANVGLVRATENMDPIQGGRFSTSASWFIKNAIKQAVAKAAYEPVFIR